jgi:hypothetical protein
MTVQAITDWMKEFDQSQQESAQYEKLPTFKILDGETKTFKLLDEGKKIKNQNGEAILFTIEESGVRKYWWVKTNSFSILKVVRGATPLTGKTVSLTRVGAKKEDTRYSIKIK